MTKFVHVKVRPPTEDEKQAGADNTNRLRALRLAKEANDRDAATRALTVTVPKSQSRSHQINPIKARSS
jgi:hypothetical protein